MTRVHEVDIVILAKMFVDLSCTRKWVKDKKKNA